LEKAMRQASSKSKRWGRRERPLAVIHQDAAGIDVGSRFHVVAVGTDRSDEPVRTDQSFTGDLERLADWLEEVGITTVAMA
jgi:transposase